MVTNSSKIKAYEGNFGALVKELVRYSFVGVSAFFIDTFVLFLSKKYIFINGSVIDVALASGLSFIVSLVYNYILSLKFVFKNYNISRSTGENFTIFTIVGVIGLLLTEIGMIIGIKLFAIDYYLTVKIVVALIVFIWNYTARKILIFR